MKHALIGLIAALSAANAIPAHATIQITEVAPWSSGNSSLGADWFELTNTGASAVNISGWKMDDNSASFASAVALSGITTIGAGESVIFIESSSATIADTFKTLWWGSIGAAPTGLQIGSYSGSGVGLGTGGDAVNIFNNAGVVQASVAFGASPSGLYATFDNAAGLNNTTISQLSAVGVNGAFVAANDAAETGSPGTIAAVPEADTYAMMLAGLGLIGAVLRKQRRV